MGSLSNENADGKKDVIPNTSSNFPRDKQKRKRTPSLEGIIYFEYVVYARPASFFNPK